jgi:hypothetical protein
VFPRLQHFVILGGVAAMGACDPNVVIGAKWTVQDGPPSVQGGSAGAPSAGGGGSSVGGTEVATAGTAGVGDGGAPEPSGGAGGAPPAPQEWCATAPWLNKPVQFTSETGNVLPAGTYVISYVSGAQIHDPTIGYEVTGHYPGKNAIEAGHHLFSGETPETSATSLWLDSTGLVAGGTIADVEQANRNHTWPLEHNGGELRITLYDDDYHDNSGPGSRFCITAAAP